MSALWQRYLHYLEIRPVLTKALTTAALFCSGDLIAQNIIERKEKSDFKRTARAASIGFFASGPLMHHWYKFLYTTIKVPNFKGAILKTAFDQSVFAPFIVSTFLGGNQLLQGVKPPQILENLKANLPSIMLVNWSIWPAAMLINFRFIPSHHQVLYVNFVALVWNTYLTAAANRK